MRRTSSLEYMSNGCQTLLSNFCQVFLVFFFFPRRVSMGRCPARLKESTLRALSKNPADRPSAEEILALLTEK